MKFIHKKLVVVCVIASVVGLNVINSAFASDQPTLAVTSSNAPISLPSSASLGVQVQLLNSAAPGQTSAGALATSYGPCVLYPLDVYQRNSFNVPPYGGVGGKAYTQCSVAVSSIHQSITIEKMGFFGFERVGPIFTDGNSNASYFIQNNAGIVCTNLKSTLWTFVVTVEVLYQGNYYYATTNAAHGPTSFPCGT